MIAALCFSLLLFSTAQGLDEREVAKILKDLPGGTKEEREQAVGIMYMASFDQAQRFVAPVQELLASKDPGDRALGIKAVLDLRLKEFRPALQTLLKSPGAMNSHDAIRAVSESRAEELYPLLLDSYKSGPSEIRKLSADRLGACPFPAAIPALLANLQSEDLAGESARALGRLRTPKAAPALLALLGSKNWWDRRVATAGLESLGDRKTIAPLRALLKDPEQKLRTDAVRCLSFLGAKEMIPELVKDLSDPNREMRSAAATALSNLDAKNASGAIQKLLGDPEPDVVITAIRVLGELEAKDALPKILDLLKTKDSFVLDAAVSAAARIGGPAAFGRLKEIWKQKDFRELISNRNEFFDIADSETAGTTLKDIFFKDPNLRLMVPAMLGLQMNRLRNPAAWEKLRTILLDGDLIGSPKELAEQIAKQAKLKLVPPELKRIVDQDWTLSRIEVRNPGRHMSLLDALHFMLDAPPSWAGDPPGVSWGLHQFTVVLENDQIRFLPCAAFGDEGGTFWTKWIQAEIFKEK